MTRPASAGDLRRITRAHAEAALVAREAGFDAVEIHLGRNYLASSFLSPRLNRRADGYGGSLANRARLARDIGRAVRDAAGRRLAVTAELNMDDGVPGGLWLDESIQVARWLEADGSVDALELTAGSSLLNPTSSGASRPSPGPDRCASTATSACPRFTAARTAYSPEHARG